MTDLVPPGFAKRISTLPPDDVVPDAPWTVSGSEWLRTLPRLLDRLILEWDLRVDGPSTSGTCAVVVPVRSGSGPAVLKVGWPHHEAAAEHLALRHWDGNGAVRLLRADPRHFALLLERADPSTDLGAVPVQDACAVIGDLLTQLRAPAVARTPRLSEYARRQVERLAAAPEILPRRFVAQARQLAAELGTAADVDTCLLHTDLHYENVLGATRQPWLAIDPKPMSGDRAFEVAPALWNRSSELGTGSSVRVNLRRRLETVCGHGGIDRERARAWTIVREVDNAIGAAQAVGGSPERVSLAVAVVKAMND